MLQSSGLITHPNCFTALLQEDADTIEGVRRTARRLVESFHALIQAGAGIYELPDTDAYTRLARTLSPAYGIMAAQRIVGFDYDGVKTGLVRGTQ